MWLANGLRIYLCIIFIPDIAACTWNLQIFIHRQSLKYRAWHDLREAFNNGILLRKNEVR